MRSAPGALRTPMRKRIIKAKYLAAAAASLISLNAFAQSDSHFNFYGSIRNYIFADTHTKNVAGIADMFYYLPEDDEGNQMTFNFANITSRVGVDVSGYEFNGVRMGARVETDFYGGFSGSTGVAMLCLRQAYLTLDWTGRRGTAQTFKMGQDWHPLSSDMPETVSHNTGSPFNPFSRTPLAQYEARVQDNLSFTAAAIWQMQYASCGPEGASANYVRYCGIPELYAGVNYTYGDFFGRLGIDITSIKPYRDSKVLGGALLFVYGQYKKDLLTVKAKTVFGNTGSQMNMSTGYAVSSFEKLSDVSTYEFTSTRHSTSWVNVSYGEKIVASIFAGYIRNFGTSREIVTTDLMWFGKNSFPTLNRGYRIAPQVIFNWGKLALAIEVEHTGAQYGSGAVNYSNGLYDQNLHWVSNTRIQSMVKFTF